MRLTAIYLTGFKSFCDRAAVTVREGITGVVGPNGCGKSNIVDALRWVLGESRAARLRGDALQDVLFNGGGNRPPGDWCAVETRFSAEENDDLGMWKGCAEIVVKRELARDGQSYFYINGQTVRRRDVVSLFRGTGVSPRSYAVVEQGVVGSIAEASADELRLFLEETAGVSHYKDRRKDAERRLASCRANLEQLARLIEDARRQQESLKRQARAARRYRELGESVNDMEVVLILRNREITAQKINKKDEEITVLDGKIAELQTQCDSLRQRAEDAGKQRDEWRQKAGGYEAELARTQEAARRIREDYEQSGQKRARLIERGEIEKTELGEVENAARQCAEELQKTSADLDDIAAQLKKHESESQDKSAALKDFQKTLRAAEAEMESARQGLQQIEHRRATAQMETQMAEEKRAALRGRLDKLRAAESGLAPGDAPPPADESEVARCENALRTAESACKQNAEELENARAALRKAENTHVAAAAERDALHSMVQKHEWKVAATPPRLSELLQAEAGEWSRALDAALGRFADGYAVESLDDFLREHGFPPAGAGIVEMRADNAVAESRAGWIPLLSHIDAPAAAKKFLSARLRGVYAAESAAEARQIRDSLADDEMLITRDGAIFMKCAVFSVGEVRGGFDWRRRLAVLDDSLADYEKKLQAARQREEASILRRTKSDSARDSAAAALSAARGEMSERRIAVGQWEERRMAADARREEMRAEMDFIAAELQRLDDETARRADGDNLRGEYDSAAAAAAAAKSSAETAAHNLETRRAEAAQSEMALRELQVRRENSGRQKESLNGRGDELKRRHAALTEQIAHTEKEIAELSQLATGETLSKYDADIAAAKNALQETAAAESKWSAKMTAHGEEREKQLQQLQILRDKNTALQLEKRELRVSAEGMDNSLEEYEKDEARLSSLRERDMSSEELRAQIAELRGRRDRLGAINFAAEQELGEGEARLEGMQMQKNDVETAADDLQKTIHRIDDETRTRMRGVYEAINREFGGLFKKMFGGGSAELAMRGNSFLDAEFEIRARPPGKQMFPVRMLSGGEKSATALAFVFTLMRHTPPPFCVMDEVDAALDDSRSDLFVGLLREMAQHFQCLVVTHNKNTIEAADNLIGVTQEEKGVSKIVSVTRAEAAKAAS